MIGDKIEIKPAYLQIAEKIVEQFNKKYSANPLSKIVIAIAGESGSGKSVTALCLQHILEIQNHKIAILHQDDYFFLPPKDNHLAREKNWNHIGPQEVNMVKMQEHIDLFLGNANYIEKPLVNYNENSIGKEVIKLNNINVLIVEGTYALQLQNLQHKIFMARTYLDTLQQRIDRGRESYSTFIEQILSIEHNIIKHQNANADMIVLKDYSLQNIL